jgi:hypothetical protein
MAKDESQPSPGRKKPIPQPRKLSSVSSSKLEMRSGKSLSPETKKEVCPVPTPQFKSFKRIAEPPPAAAALPDYVNTTPPPPPSNPPPPLEPRGHAIGRSPSSSSPHHVVMRSKKLEAAADPLASRFGVVLDPLRPATEAAASRTSPYYMSDVYRDGTPEKVWLESVRKGHPVSTPDKGRRAAPQQGKGYFQCDLVRIVRIYSLCFLA